MIRETWIQTPTPKPEELIHERLSQRPFLIKDWINLRPHTHAQPNKEHPDSEILEATIAPGETIRHEKFTDEPKVRVTWTQPVPDSGQQEAIAITWTYEDEKTYGQRGTAKAYEMDKNGQTIHDPQQILAEADNILARFIGIRAPRVQTSNSVLEGDPLSPLDPSVGEPGE